METQESNDEIGVIKKLSGNEVVVEVQRKGSCKNCSINMLCMGGNEKTQFHLKSPSFPLAAGDEVVLEISPADRIFSSFIVFIFPILTMIGFYALIGYALGLSENIAIFGSLFGLLLSGVAIKLIDRMASERILVKITGKVPSSALDLCD